MKSSKNLIIAFILGLAYFPVLYILDTSGATSLPKFLILVAIVLGIVFFAIKSLIKGESRLGAIVIILADILLMMLTHLWYFGL